jgi:hypothetical protein
VTRSPSRQRIKGVMIVIPTITSFDGTERASREGRFSAASGG